MAPRRTKSPTGGAKIAGGDDVDAATQRVFTWREVAKHNTAESAWVIVHGKVYDITPWLERHPGGKEMLLLAAGRECTDLIASYHPFTDKPQQMLGKFEIGTVSDQEFTTYKPDTGFYKELSGEVAKYFKDNNLNPKDPLPGLWRMALVFGTAALCYAAMNTLVEASWTMRVVAAVIFGICQALPLLHVMHDSSHTAFGNNETWWKIAGRFCMDWYAGASMMSWHHQHVVGHHIYTNVMGADPDMPVFSEGDPRRIVNRQKWTALYKFQHLYLPPLYGILGLKFRVQDITGTWGTHSNGPIRVNMYDSPIFRMVVTKIVWACWRVLYPLLILQVPFREYCILFVIAELMTGWWLAFNFQVSHVSTVADYPQGDSSEMQDNIDDEWAVSQVKSSVDYAHGNWLATFLSGALNYQVVHHLYPGVSQYHYPALGPIVRKVCAKYDIKYNHIPTFGKAFELHWKHLREMGRQGKRVHLD